MTKGRQKPALLLFASAYWASVIYFVPPPAELADPLAELAGLFLPLIELALFVPPALPLIIFDVDLRGLASATLAVSPDAIVATARTERNFFIVGFLVMLALNQVSPARFRRPHRTASISPRFCAS